MERTDELVCERMCVYFEMSRGDEMNWQWTGRTKQEESKQGEERPQP